MKCVYSFRNSNFSINNHSFSEDVVAIANVPTAALVINLCKMFFMGTDL